MTPTIGYESEWTGILGGTVKKRSKLVVCPECGGVRYDLGGPHAQLADGTTCADRLTGKGEMKKPEVPKVEVYVFQKGKR